MSNIIQRRIGHNRIMFMLDDANASKDIEDSISLCEHGFCTLRGDCEVRNHILDNCHELSVYTPITGCARYNHADDNELELNFEDE